MNSRNRVVRCFSFIIARSACIVLFTVLTCLLSACSPTYVLRAGYEEAKILWHRRPIEEVLRRSDLDVATREKLELVLRVRRFAEKDLAFTVGGSYSSITELASPPVVYVVTAAPRTKLEPYTWWFPIVGQVAYKGYFDADAAKQEAQRLEAQGYDTYIRTAVAFSTLGWFSDPLLPPLLRYETETLTNVIIHELFHNTFYLSGQTALNESLANFAGHRGAIAFFAKEQGNEEDATRHAVATWESELAVSNFLAEGAERLNALYASSISEADKLRQREDLFARLQEEFRNLPGPVRQNTDFASVKLNNAVVLQYLVYLKELALFEQVYQQNEQNLQATLARITEAARKEDDPFAGVRALASVLSDSFLPLLASFGDLGIIPELRCKRSWESAGLQVADCGGPTSLACCAGGRDARGSSITPGQSRRYDAKDSTLG